MASIQRIASPKPAFVRRLLCPLLIAAGCATPPATEAPATPPPTAMSDLDDSFLLGGIQVNEADLDGWLDALQKEGMNTVSVTDYAHQGDWDSDNLWWQPNPELLPEIRAAKARGLRVVLILRLALDHAFARNRFLWHGMIMPRDETLLAYWFARYETFVRHWAEVAAAEGVDLLMIGSELNALTSTEPLDALPALEEYFLDDAKQARRRQEFLAHGSRLEAEDMWLPGREAFERDDVAGYLDARIAVERSWAADVAFLDRAEDAPSALAAVNARRARLEAYWSSLIRCVRQVYPGLVGYAANFDQYQMVTFWDQLDVMGINAYFSLRRHLVPAGDRPALYRALADGWRRVLGEIAAFRALYGLESMPVVFSEMGFTPRANATIETWADTGFALVPTGPRPDAPTRMVVWNKEPYDPLERALAVRALDQVVAARGFPLRGILYWKLSSHDYHRDDEAFLLLIDQPEDDPLLAELRRFLEP